MSKQKKSFTLYSPCSNEPVGPSHRRETRCLFPPYGTRDLASRPRSLTDPHNLNISLGRRQYPEDLLLRQPRLRQAETHSTSSLRRTNLRPVPPMPHERVTHSPPSSQQQRPDEPRIR